MLGYLGVDCDLRDLSAFLAAQKPKNSLENYIPPAMQ